MKINLLSIASAAALLVGMSACHDPHEFSPTQYDEQFDSMTASFFDDDRDENSFPAEFDYDNHVITVVVPYTYPANSDSYLEMADLSHMKIQCNLKEGLVLEPALTWIDFTQEHTVTITDGYGVKTPFTLRAEIRKSKACEITDFSIPEAGVAGVINPTTHVVSLVTAEEIGFQLASVDLSHGATLEPDPRVEPVNWDAQPVITCVAQDGVTKQEYTFIKTTPEKMPFGMRAGSAKILWAKKQKDLGLALYTTAELEAGDMTRFNGSAGLAVIDDYLVINDAGMNKAYVLSYKNGNVISTIDFSALGKNTIGNGNNHRITGDKHGNILIGVSRFNNNNTMSLYKMKGLDGSLVKILDYPNAAAMCNTLSVTGDLEGDAVITTNSNGGVLIFKWVIKGGKLVSATPTSFTPGGYAAGNCWGTMDCVYTTSDPESDYFTIGYMGHDPLPAHANEQVGVNRTCVMSDGKTNKMKCFGSYLVTSNSVMNAGDYTEFNGSKFFIHNAVNTLGYGHGASLFMYDVTGGTLDNLAIDFDGGDINFRNNYGAAAANGTHDKGSNGNDVVFHVSDDGFFLYIFFEYCNGYVGCIRCDCIDM